MPNIERNLTRRDFLKAFGIFALGGVGIGTGLGTLGRGAVEKASPAGAAPEGIPTSRPTGTPTETPTLAPAETPTATAAPQPPTETPKPIDTPIPLDPNPQFIPEGQLSKYTEPSTIQTIGEKSKESDYEKMGFSLAFTDLDNTTIQRASGQSGDYWVIDVKKPVDFQNFVSNCPVVSSNDYLQKVNPFKITKPIISVTTQEELVQKRKIEPRMAPTFTIAFPASANRTLRELVFYPAGADFEWKAKPGDTLITGNTIVTVTSGKFVFRITDHFPDGSFKSIADTSYFVKAGEKLAFPNSNIDSGK